MALSAVIRDLTDRWPVLAAGVVALCTAPSASAQIRTADHWWPEGSGHRLPGSAAYSNESGELGILNASGDYDTAGHAFFEPIGTNGRACVTCHQPANAMSISTQMIQQRWQETNGRDPLFAAIDGRNCPHLPAGDPQAHSLLLERGLIRVFLPWPPRDAAGNEIVPEFRIEVVRDPTGCNSHPEYGLDSDEPMISVYRRPRMVANLKYVTAADLSPAKHPVTVSSLPASVTSADPLPATNSRIALSRGVVAPGFGRRPGDGCKRFGRVTAAAPSRLSEAAS